MPTTIGVRELKNQASRVVRAVREEMAEPAIRRLRELKTRRAALQEETITS